jgi:hypothetical protein
MWGNVFTIRFFSKYNIHIASIIKFVFNNSRVHMSGSRACDIPGFSPRRPGFDSRAVDLWFLWTKWHWDQLFSECFGASRQLSFLRCLSLRLAIPCCVCSISTVQFVPSKATRVYIFYYYVNPFTPELNPAAQRCLTRYFTADFASWTQHFVNICVKNQQIHQLFIQFINYVW